MANRRLRRILRAQWRDARVLLRESRIALLVFSATVLTGGVLFHFFYTFPENGQHPGLGEALFNAFSLIFFQAALPFPDEWHLQVLYFLIPIVGLGAVADGVLNFGAALLNKRQRGQKWQAAMASTYHNHVVVCGIGRVGFRVIEELLHLGCEVVAIDQDADGRFAERVLAAGVPLIIGDARRQENLIKAGVERAVAVIPCTNDELTNLDIALDARELNPDIRVVMRMFDPDFARRVEQGFGIQTALSTSALAAPLFAAVATGLNSRHSFYVGDTLLHVHEIVIGPASKLIGWDICKLETELNLSVVCHRRGATANLHPRPDTLLAAGDHVLILASQEILQRVHQLNGTKLHA